MLATSLLSVSTRDHPSKCVHGVYDDDDGCVCKHGYTSKYCGMYVFVALLFALGISSKMKNRIKFNALGQLPKSNRQTVDIGNIDNISTYIYDGSLSWLVTGA